MALPVQLSTVLFENHHFQQQPNSHGFNSDLKARIRVQEMEVNRWATRIEFLEEQERNLSEDLALL